MPVERNKFVAIVPANGPLANETSVTLTQLADHPLILPPKAQLVYAPDLIALFQKEGVVPQVIQEALQTNTTLNLVAAGLGCSLVCATAASMPPRNVRFIPLNLPSGSAAYFEIAMIWLPNHLREPSEQFIETVKAFIKARPKLLDPDAVCDA
jgi:DNA-binding transcriptional LysR family regulator